MALIATLVALAAWIAYDQAHRGGGTAAAGSASALVPASVVAQPSGAVRPGYAAGLSAHAALGLPARAPLGDITADPFRPKSWIAPALPGTAAMPTTTPMQAAVGSNPAPPLPFRFAGRLYQRGGVQTFISRGNDVIAVTVGDTLDGGYRVQSIGDTSTTLLYLPAGTRQVLEYDPPLTADDQPVPGAPPPSRVVGMRQ